MGRNLFKDMYLRGTIVTSADLPSALDRDEGMVWQFTNTADIADTFGTVTMKPAIDVAGTGTVTGTIADPQLLEFTVAQPLLLPGSMVLIGAKPSTGNPDTREIFMVRDNDEATHKEITLDRALTTEIPALTTTADTEMQVVIITTGLEIYATDSTHNDPFNADYGKITGSDTAVFETELVVGGIVAYRQSADTTKPFSEKRKVVSITSDTVLHLDDKFTIDLSGGGFTWYSVDEDGVETELTGTITSDETVKDNVTYKQVTITTASGLLQGSTIQMYYVAGPDSAWAVKTRVIESWETGDTVAYLNEPFGGTIVPTTGAESANYIELATQTISLTGDKFYVWMDGLFVAMS